MEWSIFTQNTRHHRICIHRHKRSLIKGRLLAEADYLAFASSPPPSTEAESTRQGDRPSKPLVPYGCETPTRDTDSILEDEEDNSWWRADRSDCNVPVLAEPKIRTSNKPFFPRYLPQPVGKEDDSEQVKKVMKPLSDKGQYELNPLVANALEEELNAVMSEVLKEDPESVSTEADKLVADSFKAEAGEQLRNILGLSATKRLLNIHTPILVKLEFDAQPSGDPYKGLLQWLNCAGIKRVLPGPGVSKTQPPFKYVAQLRHIEDFDRVCRKRTVRIDHERTWSFTRRYHKSTVKITPWYRYVQCPSLINTIYNQKTRGKGSEKDKDESINETQKTGDLQDNEKTNANPNSVEANKNTEETTTKNVQVTKTNEQDVFKKPFEPSKVVKKTIPNKTETKTTAQAKPKADETSAKSKNASTANIVDNVNTKVATAKQTAVKVDTGKQNATTATTAQAKPKGDETSAKSKNASTANIADNVNTKVATAKQTAVKVDTGKQNARTAQAKPKGDETSAQSKNASTAKVAENVNTKVATAQQTAVKDNTGKQNATTAEQNATTVKQNATTVKQNATTAKQNDAKMNTAKQNVTKVNTAKPNVPATKVSNAGIRPANKSNTKPQPKTKPDPKSKPKRKENDFDELDDEDILELMSNAIVLDECSGSDGET